MRLRRKTAVITGGARGIGSAMAERFAEEGASVVVADISGDEAKLTASRLPNALGLELDVSSRSSIVRAIEFIDARSEGIDILVNNAGLFEMQPFLDVTESSYDKLFGVNARGLFFTLQAVARSMVNRNKGGVVINVASQAGGRGEPSSSVYAASKAAVISITQSAALALIRYGIRVNAIAPGVVDTPMWANVDRLYAQLENVPLGDKTRRVIAAIPSGRLGSAREIANAAVFLASSDAEYVVGQTINVDGGNVLS
jgi:NAD(P)-dependent dehydrogenase (short-subunit alcohol dehydrogenase family)